MRAALYDKLNSQLSNTRHAPTLARVIECQIFFLTVAEAEMVVEYLCDHNTVNAVMMWQVNSWETDRQPIVRVSCSVEV